MKNIKQLFLTVLISLIGFQSQAQVESIWLNLVYDYDTDLYTVQALVGDGSATSISERVQFNSQVTVVVPTGTTFTLVENINPLQGNEVSGTGTVPAIWSNTVSAISPGAQPQSDFYNVTPMLSPTARYNDLDPTSVVDLFSFDAGACTSVRLFNNDTDPTSGEDGMGGHNYANGFTIGSPTQLYVGNEIGEVDPGVEISLEGPSEICVNDQTQVIQFEEGTWSSDDESVATVDDEGYVTGIGPGIANIIFTPELGTCEGSIEITVFPEIIISLEGEDEICINETTLLIAGTTTGTVVNGLWTSDNPSVATIDNDGIVTGVSAGEVTFSFYDFVTGCIANFSSIFVSEQPVVSITGSDNICVGDVTSVSPSTGVTWTHLGQPDICTVNNAGLVTALAPGICNLVATNASGCESDVLSITVNDLPEVSIVLPEQVCVSDDIVIMQGIPAGGVFAGVALITGQEFDPAVGPGVYTFTYTYVDGNNCENIAVGDITVVDCPDDPCGDPTADSDWIMELLPIPFQGGYNIADYLVAKNLTFNNPFDDMVFYDYNTGNVYAKYNLGNGFFEHENVLFNNQDHYANGRYDLYAEDLNGDGLVEIIIYNDDNGQNGTDITIYRNLGDSDFEYWDTKTVSDIGDTPLQFDDMNNGGWNDIVFKGYSSYYIYLSESDNFSTIEIFDDCGFGLLDVDLDGDIDIVDHANYFTNDGSGIFTTTEQDMGPLCEGNLLHMPESDLYYTSNYVLTFDPNEKVFQIVGQHPGIQGSIPFDASIYSPFISSDVAIPTVINSLSDRGLFYANPLSVESEYNTVDNIFIEKDKAVDLNNDGYTDFILILDISEPIYAFLNPNSLPKLAGKAYIDENENGICDSGETRLRNTMITIEETGQTVLTDDDGNYSFAITNGTYNLRAKAPQGTWVEDILFINDLVVDEPCIDGLDFGFVQAPAPPDVDLSISSYLTRCDQEVRFFINYENIGSEAANGSITFTFDETVGYVSSVGGTVSGNTITWDINNLNPFIPRVLQAKLLMPQASNPLPHLEFSATFTDEMDVSTEPVIYGSQLRCSYDPNDKAVQPDRPGSANKTLIDEEDFEYTIRFQNNGNDTAFLVTIIDTLDENIDVSTVQIIGQSHDVTASMMGQVVTFTFEDILLVDSMTNYPESQGYVTFSCSHIPGIDPGTIIENKADIIFDTNPPIVTNEVKNTMVSDLCEGPFSPCSPGYYPMTNVTDWLIGSGGFGGFSEQYYYYEKDSVINEIIYRKISGAAFPSFDYILLREDIGGRKVFAYSGSQQQEILLYDFSLPVGGTYMSQTFVDPFVCTEIDTISSEVGPLRRWKLVNTLSGFPMYYTEGIGGDHIDLERTLVSDPVYSLSCAYSICNKVIGQESCRPNIRHADQTSAAITICTGEEYLGQSTDGIYYDTLVAVSGCDSIVEITLTVKDDQEIFENVTICGGESYNGYTETGEYVNEVLTAEGCDSTYNLILTVVERVIEAVPISICEGDAVLFNGQTYTEAGSYQDSLVSNEGCTSTLFEIEITVEEIPTALLVGPNTVCIGDTTSAVSSAGSVFWVSSDPTVATITNDGFITAVSSGVVLFTATEGSTSCASDTEVFTVLPADDPSCTVGIEEVLAAKVNLYPNPANDEIYLETDLTISSVQVVNNNGQIVAQVNNTSASSPISIDTSLLPSGIYMVKVGTENSFAYKKVVIE